MPDPANNEPSEVLNLEPILKGRPTDWRQDITIGCAIYYMTAIVVVIGMVFGTELVPRRSHPNQNSTGFVQAFANWDGVWYRRIVVDGYFYNPSVHSSVAFFPLYPCLVKAVHEFTGVSVDYALLIVSHGCLIGAFVMTAAYVRQRYRDSSSALSDWTLLAVGLFPTTFFMRMAYTESLFILLLVTSLWGMHRNWPVFWIAAVIGLTTACRATGVALIPPLMLYLWQQRTSMRTLAFQVAIYMPLACWALIGYMAYQFFVFNDPLAFVKTQTNWVTRQPESLSSYIVSLLILEPIWSKYVPTSPAFWERFDRDLSPMFSLEFANAIYFVLMAGFIVIGYWRRWLNGREVLLGLGLLAVPYLTHSYRAVMMGHARFASSVFPAYLVMGQLLSRMPSALATIVLVISSVFLVIYSALFASWHRLF